MCDINSCKKIFIFVLISLFKEAVICSEGTFKYFAYGSNLLTKRIHINNPSAVFYSTAKLKGYRLDFNLRVDSWNGAVATIVPDSNEIVWGALWTLNISDMANLDRQEGVEKGWYFAKNVTVTTPAGVTVTARTYQERHNPETLVRRQSLPWKRLPSSTYLEVIALGAIESRIPSEYVGFLFSFPTNNKLASNEIRRELGYPFL